MDSSRDRGNHPRSETAKSPAIKALVARMNAAGLSPQTVNSYFRRVATVVDLQNGGRDRDRTGDPLLAKQVLSQLSYTPTEVLV